MFNRATKKIVIVLTLITWMFQVSVSLASDHNALPNEQTQVASQFHGSDIKFNQDGDNNACHSDNAQSCNDGYCASCLFVATQDLNTHLSNTKSIPTDNYLPNSLLSHPSSFYRPPQIS